MVVTRLVAPSMGAPRRGGTRITVVGDGFRPDETYACRFGGLQDAPAEVQQRTLGAPEAFVAAMSGAPAGTGAEAGVGSALSCVVPPLLDAAFVYAGGALAAASPSTEVAVEVVLDPARGGDGSLAVRYELATGRRAQAPGAGMRLRVYLDEGVDHLAPSMGPSGGGTEVTVHGANFLDSPNLACKFGDQSEASPAMFVSAQRIRCLAPAAPPGGPGLAAVVAVSNNGVDFWATKGLAFRYLPAPEVLALEPASGPVGGGTLVTVTGAGFVREAPAPGCLFGAGTELVPARVLSGSTLLCLAPPSLSRTSEAVVKVAVTMNGQDLSAPAGGATFEYRQAPSVYGVFPSEGPLSGGTAVTVTGANFHHGLGLWCRFGGVAVKAFRPPGLGNGKESTKLVCRAPPRDESGPLVIEVTNDFMDGPASLPGTEVQATALPAFGGPTLWTNDGARFVYRADALVSSIHPDSGAAIGGTVVRVLGSGFAPAPLLACRFSLYGHGGGGVGGGEVEMPATYISPAVVECITPSWNLSSSSSALLTGDKASKALDLVHASEGSSGARAVAVGVSVSVNGQDFSPTQAQFLYRPTPKLTSLDPPRVPAGAGGTVVTVSGDNFFDAGRELLCRFGSKHEAPHGVANYTEVFGKFLGPGEVACPAPPLPASVEIQRLTLTSVARQQPEVQVVEVSALPDSAEVQRVAAAGWGWAPQVQELQVSARVTQAQAAVQVLRTSLTHAREVQVLATGAAARRSEVQRFDAYALEGELEIRWPGTAADKGAASPAFAHNASAESFAAALGALAAHPLVPLTGTGLAVSRFDSGGARVSWEVTFNKDQGDLPLLEMGLAGSSSAASGGGGDDSAFWANSTEVVAGIGAEVQLVSMQAAARGGHLQARLPRRLHRAHRLRRVGPRGRERPRGPRFGPGGRRGRELCRGRRRGPPRRERGGGSGLARDLPRQQRRPAAPRGPGPGLGRGRGQLVGLDRRQRGRRPPFEHRAGPRIAARHFCGRARGRSGQGRRSARRERHLGADFGHGRRRGGRGERNPGL